MWRRTFITSCVAGTLTLATGESVFTQERRYLSEDQALKLIFPKSQQIRTEDKSLNAAQQVAVEKRLRYRLAQTSFRIHIGETNGQADGYAMVMNEIGKEMPITFIVGITPQFRISRVALMVFRESKGWEVEDSRFTSQFKGRSSGDAFAVNSDIIGVTGATLSSRAFCKGTKKAIVICEALYKL